LADGDEGGDFQSRTTRTGGSFKFSVSSAGANMNLKLAVFGLAMASLLLPNRVHAQTAFAGNLRGINQIDLLVEVLSENAKACQITDALIHDAFMYPASSARFAMKEGHDRSPFMYFNITTLFNKLNELCVSYISMHLQIHQDVKLEATGRSVFTTVQLWSGGAMGISTRDRHGQVVRDVVATHTKKFITDWNLGNQ